MVVAEDAGSVPVGESDLDSVIADGGSRLSPSLGLEHGQRRCGSRARGGEGALADALVVAGSTGAFFAKIRELVMAGMPVGPTNIDASSAFDVDLYGGWFFSRVDGNRHLPLQ